MHHRWTSISAFALVLVSLGCDKGGDKSSGEPKSAPKDDDKAVAATCEDSVKTLVEAKKVSGDAFKVTCPTNCSGSVWGSGWYTTDSIVCAAARHAGAVKDKSATVTIAMKKGLKSYKGTTQNGVTTDDWGDFEKSFTVNDSSDGN